MNGFISKRTWLVLFVLLGGLLAAGCFGDEDDSDDEGQPEAGEYLEEGRKWLGIGDGARARLAFLDALEIEPDNAEGLYGLVLADALQLTDVVGILTDYVCTVIDLFGPNQTNAEGDFDETEVIDRVLQILMDGLVMEVGEELIAAADALQATADPKYVHQGIPVVVRFVLRDTMTGEFDRSFLAAAECYARLLTGITGHLLTLSFEMDISLVFMVGDVDFDDVMTGIGDVVDILKLVLNDSGHPDFLIMDDQGVELFRSLGLMLGNGFDEFAGTWALIRAETDEQTDDVMGYADLDGDGVYDQGEPYFLPYFGVLDAEAMNVLDALVGASLAFRDAFWDRTVNDIDPANSNPLPLSALNPVLEVFGLPGFIPDWLTLPVGDWYAEPDPMAVRNGLQELIDLLDALFPGSGRFE